MQVMELLPKGDGPHPDALPRLRKCAPLTFKGHATNAGAKLHVTHSGLSLALKPVTGVCHGSGGKVSTSEPLSSPS